MIVEIAKKIRDLVGTFWLGRKIEQKFIKNAPIDFPPPIFIIGLPRSGSTLLYQILSERYNVTFFSNFSSVFVSYPAVISSLTKFPQNSARIKSYKSNYGLTPGLFSPSESGGIYRYWLTLNENKRIRLIRNTISKISTAYNCPFILKNLNLSTEVKLLNKIFPDALFIKIDRDLEYVVQSIYLKLKKGGRIKVSGFETIEYGSGLMNRVIFEAVQLDRIIDDELRNNKANSISVKYEKLSGDLERILREIERFYLNTGYQLVRRNDYKTPKVNNLNETKLPEKEWELMLKQIQNAKIK